jgi:3-dehydroquinate synthetase/shikimate kinase
MEIVLIGPPGSGKSAVGQRLAAAVGAEFVDLDAAIEAAAGTTIPSIFETEGEAGFRERERAVVMALPPPSSTANLARVIAPGGGAVEDPRNRWKLFRGRRVLSLLAPSEVLARRLRGAPSRPLLAGQLRPMLDALLERRARFYGAGQAVDATGRVVEVEARIRAALERPAPQGLRLLRAETAIGRISLGEGAAAADVVDLLEGLDARRVTLISEPRAWSLYGAAMADALRGAGFHVVPLRIPRGEAAKTPAAYVRLLRAMAQDGLERRDPVVAIGGGALGDAAGLAAATYLRGVPLIHVPTTLVAQIDSAIGGKTAIDLPEGKNLVGAFYQPAGVANDVAFLRSLPARHRRAALAEAIKYALLGDEALLALLDVHLDRFARGDRHSVTSGALAELVERCAWAKVEVVSADERELAGRITLNLGHSLGHAIEAAAGYRKLLHGEAVAYGLLGAAAVGAAVGVTPPELGQRVERLVRDAGLARGPAPVRAADVRTYLARDKKHAGGRLRWVLPVPSGVVVRDDVSDAAVQAGLTAALGGLAP